MITYVTFPISKEYNLLSFSPFCTKAELFLIYNEIDYKRKFLGNSGKAPRAKLPYIKYKGEDIPDSQNIIDRLSKEFDIDLDKNLTQEQKAHAYVILKMLEEHLYWIMLYFRWVDDINWKTTKDVFFDGMPAPLKAVIPSIVRKSVVNSCHSQGISRYSKNEILNMLDKSMSSLTTLLGSKKFFFGEKLTAIDFSAYGIFSNMLFDFIPNSELKAAITKYENLVNYTQNIHNQIAFKK
jgi:glutathione S-transferase